MRPVVATSRGTTGSIELAISPDDCKRDGAHERARGARDGKPHKENLPEFADHAEVRQPTGNRCPARMPAPDYREPVDTAEIGHRADRRC
jgi:hypothetical protein